MVYTSLPMGLSLFDPRGPNSVPQIPKVCYLRVSSQTSAVKSHSKSSRLDMKIVLPVKLRGVVLRGDTFGQAIREVLPDTFAHN
jgi:hypothetical protein